MICSSSDKCQSNKSDYMFIVYIYGYRGLDFLILDEMMEKGLMGLCLGGN